MILVFMLVCLFLLFIKTGSELDAFALLVFPFGSISLVDYFYLYTTKIHNKKSLEHILLLPKKFLYFYILK